MAPRHERGGPATVAPARREPVVERGPLGETAQRRILWACLLVGELWCAGGLIVLWVYLPITRLRQSLVLFDFRYYYLAALALRDNLHANIYDLGVIAAVAQANHLPAPPTPLGYPLLLPVALIPLTVFSYQTAAHIWDLLDIALWVINSVLLVDWLRVVLLGDQAGMPSRGKSLTLPRRSSDWVKLTRRFWDRWRRIPIEMHFALVLGLVISLTSGPMRNSIFLGQISMFMLTCFLLVPRLIRRGHPLLAGALIAIVALIKVVPVVLLGYYLLRGRWRVVAGALGAFAICLVGITALVGVPNVLAMRQIVSLATSSVNTSFQNQALAQAPLWIAVMFGGHPSTATGLLGLGVIALVGALFIAVVSWLTWRARRDKTQRDLPTAATFDTTMHEWLGYAWALCTMILVSPETWGHHYIWLLPPFVVALGYALRRISFHTSGRARLEVFAVLALALGLSITANGLPFGYQGITTFYLGPYIHGQPLRPYFMLLTPGAALLMWGAIGTLLWRSAPARARSQEYGVLHGSGSRARLSGAVNSEPTTAPAGSGMLPGVADGVLLYGLISTVVALITTFVAVALAPVMVKLIIAAFGPG